MTENRSEAETNDGGSLRPRAFDGVRVVELAQWVFVPVAAALLADWGADVVRIEPIEGDPYRGLATQGVGTDGQGPNLSMALANRGKRSIALDIRTEDGLAVLHELLASADVFVTSLRPGALARLGLDADSVRVRYPSLVYARGHGFGVRGPDADKPGYDSSAFWARGGVGHVLTPTEREYPISQRGAMGDRSGAMALAFGIATALRERDRTGEGTVVDVSLLATAMWMLSSDLLAALNGGAAGPVAGRGPGVNPLTGTYRTKDLRHIQLMFLQGDRYWPAFARILGREDLVDDPRFASMAARREHNAECVKVLDDLFAEHTLEEWKEILADLDAPWAPVQSVHDVVDDPQVLANGYVGEVASADGHGYRLPAVPVQLDERPPTLRRAPEHGEHTEMLLLELGYEWDRIGALQDKGVIP
ncbi:CaiB/BaiF CoA transferase family protein [Rhodococcus triatomae]|nr:formyl-CoA transferase [Rhodococcus triatomae BKS 15-14]